MRSDVTLEQIERLLADPAMVWDQVGALSVIFIRDHFEQQGFDGEKWPSRYPGQRGNKINVAGTVSDLLGSDYVKPRRFQDRPVLRGGKGTDIAEDIAHEVIDDRMVRIGIAGPTRSFAAIHHTGGPSRIQITGEGKKRIKAWLKSNKGKKYEQHFGRIIVKRDPLTIADELVTNVQERPFMALSDRERKDIAQEIIDQVKR
jgi:phage gpG-like protein